MSMGKGPGGGGLNMPVYNPQPSYQPYQPWQPPSMNNYNPMMDMYGSMTQVMQPMPNYYQQFPVPGGYGSRPYQPPPVMQPQPQPQPQPSLPGGGFNQNYPNFGNPFAGIPFNFNFDFGRYNGQPVTDELISSGPMPHQVDPNVLSGGVVGPQRTTAQQINNAIGNVSPITSERLGLPANTSASGVSNARPQSDLAGTVGTRTTPSQFSDMRTPQPYMPILDSFTPTTKEAIRNGERPALPGDEPIYRAEPAIARFEDRPQGPVQQGLDNQLTARPNFGGYTNNVRLAGLPYMGGFNFGGIF